MVQLKKSKKIVITLELLPSFAQKISQQLKAGDVVSLVGQIGAGKTSFMFYLTRALGLSKPELFSSPTFTILNQYPIKNGIVNHVDLYRLNRFEDLENLDIICLFQEPKRMTFVEWGDKFPQMQAIYTKRVYFNHREDQEEEREIICEGFDDKLL